MSESCKFSLRYEKQLIKSLGENYREKIKQLRIDLLKVIKSGNLTLLEVAYKSGLNISTVSEFLRGEDIQESVLWRKYSRRGKVKPQRDNISLKTYTLLKLFTDKRLKFVE